MSSSYINAPDIFTRELSYGAIREVKEGSARLLEGARGSRGKARSEESLRKHNVIYELKYKRKKINSNNKSFVPESIN